MASIVAAIIAIAKAIPKIAELITLLVNEWTKYQIDQIEDKYEQRKKTRDFLTKQLKDAKNDQERIAAFKLLSSME